MNYEAIYLKGNNNELLFPYTSEHEVLMEDGSTLKDKLNNLDTPFNYNENGFGGVEMKTDPTLPNKATGDYALAEGVNTIADGEYSHTEGASTQAMNSYAHAEGASTKALGRQSHSEGNYTQAVGDSSHAEGNNTISVGQNQHVQGKYNIADPNVAHIVGNGQSGGVSNAHTLDWNGNAWFAGDVYVGSTAGVNKDAGSKKLATEEYVDTHGGSGSDFVKIDPDTCTSQSVKALVDAGKVPYIADIVFGNTLYYWGKGDDNLYYFLAGKANANNVVIYTTKPDDAQGIQYKGSKSWFNPEWVIDEITEAASDDSLLTFGAIKQYIDSIFRG